MSVVVLVGSTIGVPALGENDDVGGATEGIGEDGARAEVDVGVVAGGLVGGRAIKVPDGEVLGLVLLLRESLESHCQSGRSERSDARDASLALLRPVRAPPALPRRWLGGPPSTPHLVGCGTAIFGSHWPQPSGGATPEPATADSASEDPASDDAETGGGEQWVGAGTG